MLLVKLQLKNIKLYFMIILIKLIVSPEIIHLLLKLVLNLTK